MTLRKRLAVIKRAGRVALAVLTIQLVSGAGAARASGAAQGGAEGEVRIRLPLSAEAGASKGRHAVSADLTVQPCDDRECFPPRKINAAVPVVVE